MARGYNWIIFLAITVHLGWFTFSFFAQPSTAPTTSAATQPARVLGIYLVDENHMDDGAGLIRELGGNLVVNHVISGSRAERMGLKLADVIKRINGKDMSTADDVLAEVRNSETVEIEIIRDGKNLTLGEPVPSP